MARSPRQPARRRPPHDVADLSLATAGEARIDWADAQMPVLAQVRARFAAERPLDGLRIAACLHVTAETGNLVRTLRAGGADVWLAAANPLSTQDEVAAALVLADGVAVHAKRRVDRATYARFQETVAAAGGPGPHLTMDDGGDLLAALHDADGHHAAAPDLLGGTEETTAGALRLRAMAERGELGVPVLAVHEADTHRVVENRHGTGQSALDGILRATNVLLAGRTVVVVGYGSCGRGVAARARGMGAAVIVCEVDAVKALEAKLEGFDVAPSLAAAERGDIFVTVTGNRDVLTREHFERMRDGSILANAGHFDVEIALGDLEAAADGPPVEVRPLVERYVVGGNRIHLLAGGRVVNLAAAEGYPASVMDLSFTNQALAVEALVRDPGRFGPGVHRVPQEMDAEMARLKLASLGIDIDRLTPEQAAYGRTWA
ncbi:adenosylhomocysteinase [Patulibacter sp. SYSU D01012]|uniref:adenosylhomocysteinase n=1 Tax=Patulibacter sp. SYSU D01012 TaxID=2817381 RepID=UPI001B315AA2|nr:adenosylhomocysteinase [Patulibacter sp. SYSU D01012]